MHYLQPPVGLEPLRGARALQRPSLWGGLSARFTCGLHVAEAIVVNVVLARLKFAFCEKLGGEPLEKCGVGFEYTIRLDVEIKSGSKVKSPIWWY